MENKIISFVAGKNEYSTATFAYFLEVRNCTATVPSTATLLPHSSTATVPSTAPSNTKPKTSKPITIPTLTEFLEYCKLAIPDTYLGLEFSLKTKYETFVEAGWKDGHGKEIKNWKSKIKNVIPFLKPIYGTQPQVKISQINADDIFGVR